MPVVCEYFLFFGLCLMVILELSLFSTRSIDLTLCRRTLHMLGFPHLQTLCSELATLADVAVLFDHAVEIGSSVMFGGRRLPGCGPVVRPRQSIALRPHVGALLAESSDR